MNLLRSLLNEDMPVDVIETGSSYHLKDFIKQEFGLNLSTRNGCLIMQVCFLIGVKLKINPQIIADSLEINLKNHKIDFYGATFNQIIDSLSKMSINKKRIIVKSLVFENIPEIITQIKSGQPIILPYGRDTWFDFGIENSDMSSDRMFNTTRARSKIDNTNTERAHAIMIVGYQASKKEFLLRDIRHLYLNDGYCVIPQKELENFFKLGKNPKHVGLGISVDWK